MSRPNAFVTLLTTPSYLPGALVLLHSLLDLHPEPRDFKTVCLVTPETVDAKTIGQLREAGWDMVVGVEPIGSGVGGNDGLRLMGRPDLNFALTKLHLFRLHTLFSTLIYLDADTLPIRPLAHLFTTTNPHALSACPDTGWPDCFNSGVMVIRPRESDWKGLRGLLKNGEGEEGIYLQEGSGNGSFDGADQGLLNEWFSEEGGGGDWNKLPFTYNVTPSAAYTYAPAYRRYGHKINLVHFIGPHKPWANLQGRPAGMSLKKTGSDSYDYPSLIDRWYEVYDRHIRPTAAHDPDQARRFAVPEHVAVWNLGTGVPVQPQDRLDLDQLKQAAGAGLLSLKPGQYMSLPLDGRVDLLMPRPKAKSSSPKKVSFSPTAVDSPTNYTAPFPQTLQQQTTQPATWDGSRYSPPKTGGPEMAIRMDTFYAPAWEQDPSKQSSYYSNQQSQPSQYPTLPSSVTGDQWYKDYHGKVPDKKNIKAVFPWEQSGSTHRHPDRVFPRGDSPPPQPQSQSSGPAFVVHQPSPPAEPPRRPSPPPQPKSMSDSMASYKNAWDKMPSIQRYVDKITGKPNAPSGLGNRRQSNLDPVSIQSVPPTPRGEDPPRLRSYSHDRRSDVSGDGDDEDEESSEGDEAHSPRVGMMQWDQQSQKAQVGSYPTNKKYTDRVVQTDAPEMNDAKVQAIPGGGPSPAVKTVSLPGMTSTVSTGTTVEPRRRLSRQSSSSDTVTPLTNPMTPPSDSPVPNRRGVPFPVGPHATRGGVSQSGAPSHVKRPSYGQQYSSTNTISSTASGGSGTGNGRRPSWSQQQQQATVHSQGPDMSLSAGSGGEGGSGGGGRYFDPATDVDVRKRDTQEVLTRFMKVGAFAQGAPGTGGQSGLGLK